MNQMPPGPTTLDDNALGRVTRGEVNPGREWTSPEVAERATDTSDMRQNLPILYGLTAGFDKPRVLEIGCNDGTSTLAFLKAAADRGGSVLSMDLSDTPVTAAFVNRFGLAHIWSFQQGNSHVLLPKLRQTGAMFEVILVDGDHSDKGARADVLDVEPMLVKGGILITHDSFMVSEDHDWQQPHGMRGVGGCGLLARDMLRDPKWTGTILPFNCNLAIWRRRSELDECFESVISESTKVGLLPGRDRAL
jgi:predicted O-methyltransferase YrrM